MVVTAYMYISQIFVRHLVMAIELMKKFRFKDNAHSLALFDNLKVHIYTTELIRNGHIFGEAFS